MQVLDLDKMMASAVDTFAREHAEQEGYPESYSMKNEKLMTRWFEIFYNLAPQVRNGTVKYMVGAIMHVVLNAELNVPSRDSQDVPCHIQ